ncbi:MAG: hypothetical protein R3Y24_02725 [Eubacteriales bacterium]
MKKLIILIVLPILSLIILCSCDMLSQPLTNEEVEERLYEKYGEEFVVVSSEYRGKTSQTKEDVTSYEVYPVRDETLIFYADSYTYVGVGPFAKKNYDVFSDRYVEANIQKEIANFAEEKNWEYDDFSFNVSITEVDLLKQELDEFLIEMVQQVSYAKENSWLFYVTIYYENEDIKYQEWNSYSNNSFLIEEDDEDLQYNSWIKQVYNEARDEWESWSDE